MTLKAGGRKPFQFPFGNTAVGAYILKPFIPQPAGSPTVPGVVDNKALITVSGYY